jgi:hypothetical protein
MSTSLNLYATKVFSEQPTALWALDDTTDYVSLISSANQNLDNWTVTGGSVVDATSDISFTESPPTAPFRTSYVSGVIETLGGDGNITFISPNGYDTGDLNADLGSVAIGAYFFTYDRTATVFIEYEYDEVPDSLEEPLVVTRATTIPPERKWAFVSETFALPEEYYNLRFVIKVAFDEIATPYQFAVNGINIGQWAEEFHLESLGVSPAPLPSNINIDSDGVPALPYGLDGADGYYLSRNNVLYAKNSGLPLVYGAFNSTVIFPNPNRPSLILPGFGFMNESGKFKTLTVEFWTKIQSNSLLPKKIFGPIASTDGLYVEGPFLKLKINDTISSHYVGEWDRPMLIDIRLKPERASLVLNGEEVISFNTDPSLVEYPDKFDEEDNDQDWLGFYAYDDVPLVQLDCVGIYPYEVDSLVAKRRFVYGQGVESPNNIKGLSSSDSMFVDYSFSNYAKNYYYPRMGTWRDAVVENLIPEAQSLSLPDYTLPTVRFNNQSLQQWYFDLENAQPLLGSNFISLKPTAAWDDTQGHIFFENLNLLQDDTKCFYGVFEIEELSDERQILFDLVNDIRGSRLTIALEKETTTVGLETYEDYVVSYEFNYKATNGQTVTQQVYKSYGHDASRIFLVGLHLPRLISNFGQEMASFFGAKQNVKVFVGGGSGLSDTFNGKIYRVGFSTSRNLKKIESLFSSRGVPLDYENVFDLYGGNLFNDGGSVDTDFWSQELDGGGPPDFEKLDILPHLASYTLIPKIEFNKFKLDIGIDSYWEDYVPLSYFGKYVVDAANRKYLELDFLQLNIDYPKMANLSSGNYNTEGSLVKTYITFQYLANGANSTQSTFTNNVLLGSGGVVRPGDEWLNSKYEVLDDTIIYPPPGTDFGSLSINIHIEISVAGILSNPVKISSLQLSSQALGSSPNKIGTKFGSDVIPYTKYDQSFNYKEVFPFSIYKKSTPHLYMTSNSGLRMRGNFNISDNHGMSLYINKNRNSFFKVGAFQMALKYDSGNFPEAPVQIFEIQEKTKTIKFYLVREQATNKRGYIFAINGNTGNQDTSVIFNMDGRSVKRAVLSQNSWSVIGLAFTEPLDFSNFRGAYRITSPILFNAISLYQITEQDEAERFAYRKWYAVRSEPDNVLDWDYWDESLWREVLFLSESEPTILDPGKIYKQYVGTDRLVFEDNYVLNLGDYRYSTFKDVRWSRQILDSA